MPDYVRESYLGVHWTRALLGGRQNSLGNLLLSGNQIPISRSLIPQHGHFVYWNIPATSASNTNSISQLTFHFIFGQPSKWMYSKGPQESCRHMLLSSPCLTIFLRWGKSTWRITPCRVSATDFAIHSQLPTILAGRLLHQQPNSANTFSCFITIKFYLALTRSYK